jgi:hypothetical protein
MEPSTRGRSQRGSTATTAMEDSGGRRGTRSGATLLRLPHRGAPPRAGGPPAP